MKKFNLNCIKYNIKNYLDLVKELKSDRFLKIFTIDFFSVLIFSLIATIYGYYLNLLSTNLSENWDLAGMNVAILQNSVNELELFASDLQFFFLFFFIGLIILIFTGLIIYTYSRHLVWKELNPTKQNKRYLIKWGILVISLGIITTLFLISLSLTIILIREFFLLFYYSEIYYYVAQVVASFIGFFFMTLYLNILFGIKYNFSKSYKVWDSIGEGFSIITKNFKSLLKLNIFEWLTLFFLTVIIFLPVNAFLNLSELVTYLIKLGVFVTLIAWYRIIFVKHIVKEDKSHKERSDHEHKNKEKVELKVIN